MADNEVELINLFKSVNRVLKENKDSLNAADTYNHNHGDNMVKNFQVITKAVKEKKDQTPSEQLAYASQMLGKRSSSGSAQMYAEGLARAAEQLTGQNQITTKNGLGLIQALLGGGGEAEAGPSSLGDTMSGLLGSLAGGGKPAPPSSQPAGDQSADMLSSLMGSLLGGGGPLPQAEQTTGAQSADMLSGLMGALLGGSGTASPSSGPQSTDLLSGLMGSLLGGSTSNMPASSKPQSQSGPVNLDKLLSAGMAYMKAKQSGVSTLEALVQAVMAGSQMNNSAAHSQSGQLVAGTLISALGNLLGGKAH